MVVDGMYKMPAGSGIEPGLMAFGFIEESVRNNGRTALKLDLTFCREVLHRKTSYMSRSLSAMTGSVVDLAGLKIINDMPFFFCAGLPAQRLSALFGCAEAMIGVRSGVRFQDTDNKKLVAVFPGSFWGGTGLRYGLFTLLLRASARVAYEHPDWSPEACIAAARKSDNFLVETKASVDAVFAGRTFDSTYFRSCEWYIHGTDYGKERRFEDPTQFTADQYAAHVAAYAQIIWKHFFRPKNKDLDIWLFAERVSALNAAR